MKPLEITKGIWWVGAVDWLSRDFHGYSLSPNGTTYNAFLVVDEKITLFDTVKHNFKGEMLCRIAQIVDPKKIDYVVVNHLEPDHAGALADIVKDVQPEKIFCSVMGEKAMKDHFHYTDWPVQAVKSGDEISLGKRTVKFLETRMLHWPDSMFSYIPEDKTLICNDAFGQNIATSDRFADQVCRHMLKGVMREYYGNIVLPFSNIVLQTLDAFSKTGWEVEYLLPDHGVMYRGQDVCFALDSYKNFALQKPTKKAVVFYDTMWHSTEKMARAVADGLAEEDVAFKILSLKADHHSAVMTEVMDAGAVICGSPTHNNGVLPNVAKMLTYMKGLKPQNKIGAAFGSFGWSGEAVKHITDAFADMKFEQPVPGLRIKFVPGHDGIKQAFEFGRSVGKALVEKVDALG